MINKRLNPCSYNFIEGEVLLFNKPYTWSSFHVVKNVRYILKHHTGISRIKVGHAGTLDPLATGLLIICTGKFTKKIHEIQDFDKEYTGILTLGATTPSFDLETEINAKFPIDHITEQLIQKTSKQFLGSIIQTPPLFSAVKIDGKRAYEYARNNEQINIKTKNINIYKFELTKIQIPKVFFRIECSKGTYIRSLVHDFGQALKSGAYLSSLKRIRIGKYHLSEAFEVDEFKNYLMA